MCNSDYFLIIIDSLSKICEVTSMLADKMHHLENLQKMVELQRDLVGIDSLVQPQRVSTTVPPGGKFSANRQEGLLSL